MVHHHQWKRKTLTGLFQILQSRLTIPELQIPNSRPSWNPQWRLPRFLTPELQCSERFTTSSYGLSKASRPILSFNGKTGTSSLGEGGKGKKDLKRMYINLQPRVVLRLGSRPLIFLFNHATAGHRRPLRRHRLPQPHHRPHRRLKITHMNLRKKNVLRMMMTKILIMTMIISLRTRPANTALRVQETVSRHAIWRP